MKERVRLLVVDDDPDIRELLAGYLSRYDMDVDTAADGNGLFEKQEKHRYNLIILDIMLPGEDGLSLFRRIRDQSDVPVIFLTALDSSTDRVVGLELGADDYVVKPFDPRELLARIRTVLRRVGGREPSSRQRNDLFIFAGWKLDVRSRELSCGEERTTLSDALYRLLLVFLEEPFAVLGREYLLNRTQGREAEVFDRSVDIQVSRLRAVLHDAGAPKLIKTVRGGGYMLATEVERISS